VNIRDESLCCHSGLSLPRLRWFAGDDGDAVTERMVCLRWATGRRWIAEPDDSYFHTPTTDDPNLARVFNSEELAKTFLAQHRLTPDFWVLEDA
jgi:hypothetical protein